MLFLSHLQDEWIHNVPTRIYEKWYLYLFPQYACFHIFPKYLTLEIFSKGLTNIYPYLHNTSSTLFCFFLKLPQTWIFDRWNFLGSVTEIVSHYLAFVPAPFCAPLLPNTTLVGTHLRTHSNTMMIPTTKLELSAQGGLSMDTILPCIRLGWQRSVEFLVPQMYGRAINLTYMLHMHHFFSQGYSFTFI